MQTAIKTVLALMLSTGLVACVTDDSDTDTQERSENPDPLPDEDKDTSNVNPTDVTENPADVPGRIPAPIQDSPHAQIQNQSTTDLGMNRGNDTITNGVVVGQSTQNVNLVRGAVDTTHVTGGQVGDTCEGQNVNCRVAAPLKHQR